MECWLSVVVATPAHSGVAQSLTYRSEQQLAYGSLVRVPFGSREVLGIVWGSADAPADAAQRAKTKDILSALDGIDPLNAVWRQLLEFTARYYQRSLGEVALSALPPQLRELDAVQLARRQTRAAKKLAQLATASDVSASALAIGSGAVAISSTSHATNLVAASAQQTMAIEQFFSQSAGKTASPLPALLFGSTGSGKTEVYLRCAEKVLQSDPSAQVLVMVPEINLTPQLQRRFEQRFASQLGAEEGAIGNAVVVSMHSGMTPAQRLKSWLAAHTGAARIVLGTRLAVLASFPNLRLIIVDEEHDPSYKAQDGARHSARDMAVYRARLESTHHALEAKPDAHSGLPGANNTCVASNDTACTADASSSQALSACRVLLGSATPSLESWHAADKGRYQRLQMPERVGGGAPAALRLVDMRQQPQKTLFAPALLAAIQERVARGEQSLIFLNRRGYAPVLACGACDWKSACPHCSAFRVFHKIDRTLRCHHCGLTDRVPRACPECGNVDISPVGRGTEKLEEQLAQALGIDLPADPETGEFTGIRRPDGSPVVIARIDADTTRLKGALEQQLAMVHSGEVDILVGTQMVAKGHDFRRITLVAAVNPDSALFSSDFRASERIFSLLMQAAGRAGRDAAVAGAQMWVQTHYPEHPLFGFLKKHDFAGFADHQLKEREQALMPPFSFQALVRAEARTQEVALAFLQMASEGAVDMQAFARVTIYPPVPMQVQRIANVERAQMLVESSSRAALQSFLSECQAVLHGAKVRGLIRWAVDVDPLSI